MILLGIVLLTVGFVVNLAAVWTTGIIALAIDLGPALLGPAGRAPAAGYQRERPTIRDGHR